MTDQERCAFCGAELDSESPVCPSCGAPINAETTYPPSEAYVPPHVVNPGPTTEAGVERPAPETLPPNPVTSPAQQVYAQSATRGSSSASNARRRSPLFIACLSVLLLLICCGALILMMLLFLAPASGEIIGFGQSACPLFSITVSNQTRPIPG